MAGSMIEKAWNARAKATGLNAAGNRVTARKRQWKATHVFRNAATRT